MKNKSQIKMDFTRAYQEADQVERIADKLIRLANKKMEQSMMHLSSAWTGTNSRYFLDKESQLKEDMIKTARRLNHVAEDIRGIARRVYDAEMRAYEIASHRNTSSSSNGGSF